MSKAHEAETVITNGAKHPLRRIAKVSASHDFKVPFEVSAETVAFLDRAGKWLSFSPERFGYAIKLFGTPDEIEEDLVVLSAGALPLHSL